MSFTVHLLVSCKETLKVRVPCSLTSAQLITLIEFVPYIFQILAASLEANPSKPLPLNYQSLVGPLLSPELWVMKGNIPALVRLLAAIIPRGASEIANNNQLETLLSIFQQLVSAKANEIQGFELLECIVANFPALVVDPDPTVTRS